MEKNVGGYDRIVRFVVGPVLIVVGGVSLGGFFTLAAGTLGLVLGVIALLVGVVLTVTAVTQKCPLNSVIGLDTYTKRSAQQSTGEESKSSAR